MKNHAIRLSAHQAAAELAIVQSVTKILWRSIAVVAATELSVMLLLKASGQPITLWTSLIDTLLLSAIALPALYAATLRPVAHLAAEYSAAAAEARFQAIAGAVQDGIVISSWDRKIRFANQAAEKMFGFPNDMLQGRELEELMPPEYVQRCREGMARYRATGEPRVVGKGVVELEGQRQGGERFPVEFSLNELTLANETSFVAILRDITERKRVEIEMARLANFPRLNPSPILECEPDGRITYANPAGMRLLETAGAGEASAEAINPELPRLIRRCFEENAGVFGTELPVGAQMFLWCLQPVPVVGRVHAYAMDISERKRAEQALVESERRLRKILDALPVGVRIVQENRVVLANPADARMRGYSSPADVIGSDAFAGLAPHEMDRMREYAQRRAAGEEAPRRYEVNLLRQDGTEFAAQVHAQRMEHEGAPASLLVIEDLTERQRLQMYEQILPVCCTCGKIRNDEGVGRGQGAWERLDHYVAQHSDAQVSHTFCPECLEEYRRGQGLK